jgi:hypothetical protein
MCIEDDELVIWMGHADVRDAPTLGAPAPRGTMVDECMGSFRIFGPQRGTMIRLGMDL